MRPIACTGVCVNDAEEIAWGDVAVAPAPGTHAAGFDLRLQLAAYDTHDDVLAELEAGRSESERQRRDRQLQAWRQATSAEDVA